MSAATYAVKGKLTSEKESFGTDDKLTVWGYDTFSTTATEKELDVSVSLVEMILCMPKSAVGSGEFMGCDGVITTGAVTVARNTGTTSALTYWYLYIGPPGT
jgi:hypothetical protein